MKSIYVTTIAWCKYASQHSITLGNNFSVEVENVKMRHVSLSNNVWTGTHILENISFMTLCWNNLANKRYCCVILSSQC